ncbi:hypothetical protein L208DRAFT_626184 [Tricholoma matsutake]|nr:hypothetical protein L208DRAFT_626184 [Tricholoma matsutake 945]
MKLITVRFARCLMIEIRLCSRDYYIKPLLRVFPCRSASSLTSPSSTSPSVSCRGELGCSSPVSSLVLSSLVLHCSQLPRISCHLGQQTTFYCGSSIFSSSPISPI